MEPFDLVQQIVHSGATLQTGIAAYCKEMRAAGGPAAWGEVAEVDYSKEFVELRDHILAHFKKLGAEHTTYYLAMAEYADEDDDNVSFVAFDPRGVQKFDPAANDLIWESEPLAGEDAAPYVPDPLADALAIKGKKGKAALADTYAFPLLYLGLLVADVFRSAEAAALPDRAVPTLLVVGHEEGDWLVVGTWSGGRLVIGGN